MIRKLIKTSIWTTAAVSALLVVGCAQTKPYSLTGDKPATAEQQKYIDRASIDDKGHWNATLNQRAKDQVRVANLSAE